jgi:DNA-binding NtrC family response regulator
MKNLLIVDDDRALVESLCVVFHGRYHLHTAFSAEEAVRLLREQPVDAMLLDVVLPGIDGVAFLKTLRRDYPQLPVVMISGAASIRPVMQALDLGAVDYIRKPFDIDALRRVVSRSLNMSELQARVEELEDELARRPLPVRPGGKPLKQIVDDLERELIQEALEEADGVQTRAAETLGTTRRVLRYRIDKLGIQSRTDSID